MVVTCLKIIGLITIIGGFFSSFAIFDGIYILMSIVSCAAAGLINLGIAESIEHSKKNTDEIFLLMRYLEKELYQGVKVAEDELSETKTTLETGTAARLLEESRHNIPK